MQVVKRNGQQVEYNQNKIIKSVKAAWEATGNTFTKVAEDFIRRYTSPEAIEFTCKNSYNVEIPTVEIIQDIVERCLMTIDPKTAKRFILYREKHHTIRDFADKKIKFIETFKKSDNTANSTIDDNSNVSTHNMAVCNAEIHKEDNQNINYRMLENKLRALYPDFDYKQMVKDFNSIAYLHDSSSQIGLPYCVAITLYPFLINGIKELGGLSASPKNLDSFCGMFVNLVFAISSQFKGAIATPSLLNCFDYFCRKEWGDNYYKKTNVIITSEHSNNPRTMLQSIHQYFQQIVYSLMQPAGGRGNQSVFWNLSIFDKPFYDTMYSDFYFPDGTKAQWESLNWLQKEFVHWFNQERLRCILTFPVISICLIYKDNKFLDKDLYEFVCKEYAEGNSFFTYISDSADSLSSCCFIGETKATIYVDETDGNNITRAKKVTTTFANLYDNYKDKGIYVKCFNPYTGEHSLQKTSLIKIDNIDSNNLLTIETGYYKNPYNKIVTVAEPNITCTKDHLFPVDRDGKISDIYAKDLKVGDTLIFSEHGIICKGEILNIGKVSEDCPNKVPVYCLQNEDEKCPYFILPSGLVTHNCRLSSKLSKPQFNFTNGQLSEMTGSKNVITLNLNRIIQDWCKHENFEVGEEAYEWKDLTNRRKFVKYLINILDRIYKYQISYNAILVDLYEANMLSVYNAGFIDMKKQYLTVGINGLNQAWEFIGGECTNNKDYKDFCNLIFTTIKEENLKHKTKELMFNTEFTP